MLAILPSSTVVRQGHMCAWNVPLTTCWSCSTGRATQGEPAAGQDFWMGPAPFGSHGLLLHRCTCSDFPGPSSIKRVTGVQNNFPRQHSWNVLLGLLPLVLKEGKKFSFFILVDITSFPSTCISGISTVSLLRYLFSREYLFGRSQS